MKVSNSKVSIEDSKLVVVTSQKDFTDNGNLNYVFDLFEDIDKTDFSKKQIDDCRTVIDESIKMFLEFYNTNTDEDAVKYVSKLI